MMKYYLLLYHKSVILSFGLFIGSERQQMTNNFNQTPSGVIMPPAPCAELGGVIDVRQIDEELDINGRMIGALAEGEQVLDPRTMPELVVQGLITHSKRRIELLLLRTQITGDLSV
jgi:hypothetical protein